MKHPRLRVTFKDRDGKGLPYARALDRAGHHLVDHGDVLLIDADIPVEPYASLCDSHERVVLYPHGAGASQVGGDGQWPVHPHTVCRFVIGTGHADILRLTRYPIPVVVAGWPFCLTLPFRPVQTPLRVLLAPQHTMADGQLEPGAAEANRRLHDLLADLYELTVRYAPVGDYGVEHLGITRRPDVTYQEAKFDVTDGIRAIDQADIVVAADGTFPSLAIARGCPTVMYGQHRHDDHENEHGVRPAKSWDLYADDCRYPYDADHADIVAVLTEAGQTEATDWRDRFVGEQLDPERFVKEFEKAVGQ